MTSILSQIREEASKRADSMPLEILERAQKNLTQSRFERIRKNKSLPRTEQEKEYLKALKKYVSNKLLARKFRYSDYGLSYASTKAYYVRQAEFWRNEMDRIEDNPYISDLSHQSDIPLPITSVGTLSSLQPSKLPNTH